MSIPIAAPTPIPIWVVSSRELSPARSRYTGQTGRRLYRSQLSFLRTVLPPAFTSTT
jgi:hypothetical protein